jgi:hypothetical protein
MERVMNVRSSNFIYHTSALDLLILLGSTAGPHWIQYSPSSPVRYFFDSGALQGFDFGTMQKIMQLQGNALEVVSDNYRAEQMEFVSSHSDILNI